MDPMPEVDEGWDTYISLIYPDSIIQNEVKYDLLKFNRREGPLVNVRANLKDSQLAPISWSEKYGRHVPRLK